MPRWNIPGVGEFTRCPLRNMSRYAHTMLEYHVHYKNGVMLVAGGLLDQPARYIQAMLSVDSAVVMVQKGREEDRDG